FDIPPSKLFSGSSFSLEDKKNNSDNNKENWYENIKGNNSKESEIKKKEELLYFDATVNSESAPLHFRMKNTEISSATTTKEAAAPQSTTKSHDNVSVKQEIKDADNKELFSLSSTHMFSQRGLGEKISIKERALSRTLKWKETTYKNIGKRNKFRKTYNNHSLWIILIFLAVLSVVTYFYISVLSPVETPTIVNSINNQTLNNGGSGDLHYLDDNLLLQQEPISKARPNEKKEEEKEESTKQIKKYEQTVKKLKQIVGLYSFYKNEKDHAVNAEVVKELTSPLRGDPHFTYKQPFQHLVLSHETPKNYFGCRPFSSVEGNLTLKFKSELRRIKAIAYVHMDPDLTSAPKEIEIHTITKNDDNDKYHYHDYTKVFSIIKRFVTKTKYSLPIPPLHDFQFIANFTYAIDQMPLQIFEIPSIVQPSTGIRYLLFNIKSNWGNEATCLSRFRVYGELIGDDGS
ncbi:10157_t:CDS:2, partial [Ambispora leptoticha]